jgi:hypothetical protein
MATNQEADSQGLWAGGVFLLAVCGVIGAVCFLPAVLGSLSDFPPIVLGGFACIAIGALLTAFFAIVFDVSVQVEGRSVVNAHLLSHRQSGLLVGVGLVLFGGILLTVDRLNRILDALARVKGTGKPE